MSSKKFAIIELNKKNKQSLANLFKDIGKTLLVGLMVNTFLEVKDVSLVQAIAASVMGIDLYLLGMVLEEED